MQSTPRGLIVFDMDGTLIPEETASQSIGKETGTLERVLSLEASYRANECSPNQFAQELHSLWAKHPGCYRRAYKNTVQLNDIPEAIASIHEHGFATCLITMSPLAFAINFSDFEFVYGSLPPHTIIGPEDKPIIAQNLAESLKVPSEDIFAVGDSESDIPLFNKTTYSLTVNATKEIESLATHTYTGNSLSQAVNAFLEILEME